MEVVEVSTNEYYKVFIGSGGSSRSSSGSGFGGGRGFFGRGSSSSPARASVPATRPPVMHHQQQRP